MPIVFVDGNFDMALLLKIDKKKCGKSGNSSY